MGPLADGVVDRAICSVCRRNSPAFGRAVCAFDYSAPATREWILGLKHGGRTDLAAPLASAAWRIVRDAVVGERETASRLPGDPRRSALLVPVPLHLSRRIERGYDQAAQLAREFAALGVGRFCPLLQRARATWSQGDPAGPGRRKNVSGAFQGIPMARIPPGTAVWLVDDVMTTGATATACAKTLRSLGADQVNLLAVARA